MEEIDEDVLEVFVRDGEADTKVELHSINQLFADYEKNGEDFSESEDEKVGIRQEDCGKKRKKGSDDGCTKKRTYIQKYRKEWETIPAYRSWLSESVLGSSHFYCKFCKNNNKCGKTEIDKHMTCKKHITNSKAPRSRVQRKFTFRGLLCPAFTPFKNKDQELNLSVIPHYANYLSVCDIKGILINDVVGEGMSLTHVERMKLTEQWVPACEKNNQHLMVQVGGAPLKEVQEMVQHAEKKKVGSIVVLPDVNNKPKDHFELMRYIKLVADSANTLPILYHHNPSVTGVYVDMQKFLLDIIGEIDNFVGIIFSDNNLHEAISALHVNEEKFTVFMGTDEIILGSVASGFNSLVGSCLNYIPKLAQTIYDCVKVGNLHDANQAEKYLRSVLEAIYRYGDAVPTAKAAMSLLTPVNVGLVRSPLVSVWQDKIVKMKADLQRLQITPPELDADIDRKPFS